MVQRKGERSRRESSERASGLKEKAQKVIERLRNLYPDARLELEYDNAFQLLVEAILAAQESDKKVNKLRGELFRKYRSPDDFVKASLEEIESDIRSISFYRRKAKLIKMCCEALIKEFGGDIPQSVEDMIKLPGVGRKTANMVLGCAFGLPAIIVDRHVLRVSQRIGFTRQKDPDRVESELMDIVPKEEWTSFSLLLLNHGKRVCTAKNPKCEECSICDLCESCMST